MMLALEMFRSVSRTMAGRAIGGRVPGVLSGFAAPLRLVTIEEPRVQRPGWARVRTRLSGICGSDLGALSGRTSLYFSAVVSLPFVPGHEVVGELLEDCEDLPAGTRVVLDPVLACAARGVEPCEACARGERAAQEVTAVHQAGVLHRTTNSPLPRPLRCSQANTESTVTVSMRSAKRLLFGWSSNVTLAAVTRAPRRVRAPSRKGVGW